MLADGLGHGPLAAAAAARATETMLTSAATEPGALVTAMHHALTSTRGAAIAVVRVDRRARAVTYSSVGNIAGRLLGGGRARTLAAQPGIVGHRMPRLREHVEPLDGASTLVLHSDGLSDKWTIEELPGVLDRGPGVLAGALVRGAGVRRDDASVLVARTAAP
jgi:hypothetical protein